MSDTTLATANNLSLQKDPGSDESQSTHSALTVIWWPRFPHRVGETVWIPHTPQGQTYVLGRGSNGQKLGLPRLEFTRQDPVATTSELSTGYTTQGPIQDRKFSRDQLLIKVHQDASLHIQNIGRPALVHKSHKLSEATIHPGEIFSIEGCLSFYYTHRRQQVLRWPANTPIRRSVFGLGDDFGLVGESEVAWELRRSVALAAQQSCHVLITGPTGAGKENIANAIHLRSSRAKRPLVSRNAATFPRELIAAELYGNMRNYPNPGMPERPGLIGKAHRSNLFIDEIGELPHAHQASLLRVLDAGEYSRLGEATHRIADFNLIAATNRPPTSLKLDFRQRFAVHLTVAGLNSRREDIPLLIQELLRRLAAKPGNPAQAFCIDGTPYFRLSRQLVNDLLSLDFTTHVRELNTHLIECINASSGKILNSSPALSKLSEARRKGLRRHKHISGSWVPAPLHLENPYAQLHQSFERSLSAQNRFRMSQQRLAQFRPSECSDLPSYGFSRQTAGKHRKVLLAHAYKFAKWDNGLATKLLVGSRQGQGSQPQMLRTEKRLRSALNNLLTGLKRDAQLLLLNPNQWESRQKALRKDYGKDAEALVEVIEFLSTDDVDLS